MTKGSLAGVMLGAMVLAPAAAHAQFLSPGPLARGHASIEGDDECDRCHASGRGVVDAKCLGCHAPIARSIQAQRGLHGVGYRGQPCGRCHVDHRGAGARLVRWPGGGPSALDHRLTGWPLVGGHADETCQDCHAGAQGGMRFLGTSSACGSCHQDPHQGRFGAACASCHSQARWGEVRLESFDHTRARFSLTGRHASVACAQCHGQPPRWRGITFGTCADCHRDPHAGRMRSPCASCHSTTGWSDLGAVRQNHPGLSLGGGHSSVACGRCHDSGVDRAPSRGAACASCHAPVHEAEFGRRCPQCHRGIRWTGLPRAIGLEAHARTPFPLRGEHGDVECNDCHDPRKPPDARYRELSFEKCTGCHADPHEGTLAQRLGGGDCAPCHDERGFRPTRFGATQHAATAFPLVGRHQAAPCGECHEGQRPRTSLRVAAQRCQDCHEDPHEGQFDREIRDGGCARCHSAVSWHEPNVDHRTWPLTGAHAAAACSRCHAASAEDRARGGGASYRGVPRDCDGCHEDPHAGQFRLSEPRRSCDDCHETAAFAIARFDHQREASWRLEGRHEAAPCRACHVEQELRNGARAVRYRLGYQACADCHANPHRQEPRR